MNFDLTVRKLKVGLDEKKLAFTFAFGASLSSEEDEEEEEDSSGFGFAFALGRTCAHPCTSPESLLGRRMKK
jgi:hypothetical protein